MEKVVGLKDWMGKSFYRLIDVVLKPSEGLNRHLFYITSMLTPLVCLEIFVHDQESRGVVLIYRDDEFYGPGWHLPGGILRSREEIETRVFKTVMREIGVSKEQIGFVKCISLAESFDTCKPIRSHFIAIGLLVEIDIREQVGSYVAGKDYVNGEAAVHREVPKDMIVEHIKYSEYIQKVLDGRELREYALMSTSYKGKW